MNFLPYLSSLKSLSAFRLSMKAIRIVNMWKRTLPWIPRNFFKWKRLDPLYISLFTLNKFQETCNEKLGNFWWQNYSIQHKDVPLRHPVFWYGFYWTWNILPDGPLRCECHAMAFPIEHFHQESIDQQCSSTSPAPFVTNVKVSIVFTGFWSCVFFDLICQVLIGSFNPSTTRLMFTLFCPLNCTCYHNIRKNNHR